MNSAFIHLDDRYDHRAKMAQSSRAETVSTTEEGNMKNIKIMMGKEEGSCIGV